MMVPSAMTNYSAVGYQAFVRQHLDKLSERVDVQLQTLLALHFEPSIRSLEIQIDPRGLGGPLPATVLFKDEFGRSRRAIHLLEQVQSVIPPTELTRVAEYNEAGVETTEVELQTLVEWLIERWLQAGGLHFPVPVHIGIQDDIEYFDLGQGQWVPRTNASELPHQQFPIEGENHV